MGFETAFNEITLVLFTTLAPSGALAYGLMAFVALRAKGDERLRVSKALLMPFLVSLVGLVASATHLGNPDNALYVFTRVGQSSLSNEVCAAVLFLGASGSHWLYQHAEHAKPRVLNILLVLAIAASLVFLASIALAYASRTVITWSTPFVPVALCLNALVGGPILALAGLRLSQWGLLAGHIGRILLACSAGALLANVGVYLAQGVELAATKNYLVSAIQLVGNYEVLVLVFFLLAVAGLLVDALPLMRGRGLSLVSAVVASALVFSGIFIMRFAFYMMHMTAGISL
ncbi:dimethyl sulfoxide reductase anchor subunit family protein [Gordonibacter sp.]|uniref:dimethyl sulfoxide reductase anchor subunit family protein n=1 Tax=Gordonibacter sp. TaxID=1968902 RepID=UPI002FC7BF3F